MSELCQAAAGFPLKNSLVLREMSQRLSWSRWRLADSIKVLSQAGIRRLFCAVRGWEGTPDSL